MINEMKYLHGNMMYMSKSRKNVSAGIKSFQHIVLLKQTYVM